MNTPKLKNRWIIAASAVGIHISIGSVYAYSVMTNPVKDVFEVEGSVIKWAFKIAILLAASADPPPPPPLAVSGQSDLCKFFFTRKYICFSDKKNMTLMILKKNCTEKFLLINIYIYICLGYKL